MRKLFICCNGGHLFRDTRSCPYDGWTHEDIETVLDEYNKNQSITHEDLDKKGISDYLLKRIFIIETGLPQCSVNGITIKKLSQINKKEDLIIDGKYDFLRRLDTKNED